MMAQAVAFAQAPAEARAASAVPPDLAAFLAGLPAWGVSVSAAASYGFKDNLLLSPVAEERSPFARGNVSFFLWRVPTGQFDFSLLADADRSRYFSGDAVEHDAKAITLADAGYRFGEVAKLSLPVTGYYSDRVQDDSESEAERLVSRMKVTGASVGPTFRWNLHPSWWLEGQALAERKRYEGGGSDGDVGEGSARLAWKPLARVELRLTAIRRWRDFEQRLQTTAAGRELAGTQLKAAEREGQLRCDVTWDEAARWKSSTRVGARDYRDNGSGYFNFREKKIAHEVEWKGGRWLVAIEARAWRLDYAIQTVGFGIDPPPRIKDEFSVELRVERTLGRRWTALAGYTWERSRSNDPFASYRMNEGLLGLRWGWEK